MIQSAKCERSERGIVRSGMNVNTQILHCYLALVIPFHLALVVPFHLALVVPFHLALVVPFTWL